MKRVLLSIFIIVCFANFAYSQEGALIVTVAPSAVPYGWIEGNEAVGPSVELMKMVFADLGIPIKSINIPWPRSLLWAKSGKIDAILTIFYNEERAKYIDFTIPYTEILTSVFVKKGETFPFKIWDDLIGLGGLGIIGDSQSEEFEKFAESKLKIHRVSKIKQVFGMLVAGRADYAVWVKGSTLIKVRKLGYSEKIEILPVPISSQNVLIGFSKKSKFRNYLPKVNKKIKQLRDDGTIDHWIEKAIMDAADR
jgi:polar amino acid transport system substrate-binding protein